MCRRIPPAPRPERGERQKKKLERTKVAANVFRIQALRALVRRRSCINRAEAKERVREKRIEMRNVGYELGPLKRALTRNDYQVGPLVSMREMSESREASNFLRRFDRWQSL